MIQLVTIESVQVKSTAGKGRIYGEILLNDNRFETVYQRSIRNPEAKQPGDFLTLTGPSTGVNGYDTWILYVSLYDNDNDHEVAVGEIVHDMANSSEEYYCDKALYEVVEGKFGAVTVRYNILSEAVNTKIEVVLEEEAIVFGTIKARQYLGEKEGLTAVTLFGKSAGEGVAVLPGCAIPLDRWLVGVPKDCYVIVEVDLRVAGDGREAIIAGAVKCEENREMTGKSEKIGGTCGLSVRVSIDYVNHR